MKTSDFLRLLARNHSSQFSLPDVRAGGRVRVISEHEITISAAEALRLWGTRQRIAEARSAVIPGLREACAALAQLEQGDVVEVHHFAVDEKSYTVFALPPDARILGCIELDPIKR